MRSVMIIAFLSFAVSCFAAHITGSAFSYKVLKVDEVEQMSYVEINLRLYRETTGGGANFDTWAEFGAYKLRSPGVYELIKVIKVDPKDISKIIVSFNTNNCTNLVENIVEKADYTAIFELDLGSEYIIAYQRCCRSNSIINLKAPGDIGLASTLTLKSKAIDHVNNGFRQKTDFEREITVSQVAKVDFGYISDNKISYQLGQISISGGLDGLDGNGDPTGCYGVRPDPRKCYPPYNNAEFGSGFSFDKPMGSQPFQLNNETGIVEVFPHLLGIYNFSIDVKEYLNDEEIAYTNLDWSFLVSLPKDVYADGFTYIDSNEDGVYNDTIDIKTSIPLKFTENQCGVVFKPEGNYVFFPSKPGIYKYESGDPNFIVIDNKEIDFTNFASQTKNIPLKVKENIKDVEVDLSFARRKNTDLGELLLVYTNNSPNTKNLKLVLNLDSLIFNNDDIANPSLESDITLNGKYQIQHNLILHPWQKRTTLIKYNYMPVDKFEIKNKYKLEVVDEVNGKSFSQTENIHEFIYHNSDLAAAHVSPNFNNNGGFNNGDDLVYTIDYILSAPLLEDKMTLLLSEKLDPYSFKIIHSSVSLNYILIKDNQIILSYSSNSPHLFIKYSITPKFDQLIKGEEIYTTVSNLNAPVFTEKIKSVYGLINDNPVTAGSQIKIYPNPSSDLVNFDFELNTEEKAISISIFDAIGKYASFRFKSPLTISSLPKGLYKFQIVTNQRVLQGGRFYKL